MVVLVTGGAGFIGRHTVDALCGAGHAVRVLDDLSTGTVGALDAELSVGDVRDQLAVRRSLSGVDALIHLAARTSVPDSFREPLDYESVNDQGTAVVLDQAFHLGIPRVVLASSAAVYGDAEGPVAEDAPLDPRSPYAASKLAMEAQGRVYGHRGLAVTVLRYFNVYGPGQDAGSGAVIPRFLDALRQGRPLPIQGDGEQGRDFVHVADVARANVAALDAVDAGTRTLNVGSGRLTRIARLAELVGGGRGVRHEPRRGLDIRSSVADIDRARVQLGWSPRRELAEGLGGLLQASERGRFAR